MGSREAYTSKPRLKKRARGRVNNRLMSRLKTVTTGSLREEKKKQG